MRDAADQPPELRWAERIEALREELEASQEELTIRYHGVAPGGEPLRGEEERTGRLLSGRVRQAAAAALPPESCLLLHLLVRLLRPVACLELGTCLGISTAYIAAALELNRAGSLVSLEGSESLADLARRNLEALALDRVEIRVGRFQDTLAPLLGQSGPIDFAFIDGHHEESATVAYFQQLRPHLAPGAAILFDDIAWSEGMTRAWRRIANDEGVGLALDLGRLGFVRCRG